MLVFCSVFHKQQTTAQWSNWFPVRGFAKGRSMGRPPTFPWEEQSRSAQKKSLKFGLLKFKFVPQIKKLAQRQGWIQFTGRQEGLIYFLIGLTEKWEHEFLALGLEKGCATIFVLLNRSESLYRAKQHHLLDAGAAYTHACLLEHRKSCFPMTSPPNN